MKNMSVHDRIKRFREAQELTHQQFADAVGVSRGAVQQWERGATAPTRKNQPTVAAFMGISVAELMDDEFTNHPGSESKIKRANPLIPSSPEKDRMLLIEKDAFRAALPDDALRQRVQFKPPHKDSKNICSYTDYRSDKLLMETLVNRDETMLKNSSTAVLRLLIQHKNDGPGRRILAIAVLTDQPITVTTDGTFDDYLPVVVQEACSQFGIRIKIVSTWSEAADWIVKLEKEDT